MPKPWLLLACFFISFGIQAQELVDQDSTSIEPNGFNFSLKEPKKYVIADISVSGTQYLDYEWKPSDFFLEFSPRFQPVMIGKKAEKSGKLRKRNTASMKSQENP